MNAKCCRRFKIFQANAKSVFFWYFKCESAFNILLLLRQKLPKTDKPLSYPVSDKNMYMNMIPSISLKIVLTFIHKSNLLAMVHVHILLKELNYNCILTMNTTLCSKFELKCGKLFWFHCRTYYSNPTFLLLYRGIIMLQNPSPLAFLSPCMHFSTQVINNNTKVPIPYQVLTCILVSGCIKH